MAASLVARKGLPMGKLKAIESAGQMDMQMGKQKELLMDLRMAGCWEMSLGHQMELQTAVLMGWLRDSQLETRRDAP